MWIDRSDKSDHSFLSVTCRWDYVLLYLFGNLSNVCWAIYIDVWDSELQTQNFSIKLFLPWWKKFTCSEFSQISFGANYFIAHIDWIFFFFNTMKHILFFKTFPVPEVFPVVLLQMFTSTAGRWRDVTSNVVLLHSRNGCPLMKVRTAVRAALQGPHTKASGLSLSARTQ